MARRVRIQLPTALLLAVIVFSAAAPVAFAADRQKIARSAGESLKSLYASNTAARLLREKARAVLVFPNIVKAGFMFGGQIGDGAPLKNGQAVGYYNSLAASSNAPLFQAASARPGFSSAAPKAARAPPRRGP